MSRSGIPSPDEFLVFSITRKAFYLPTFLAQFDYRPTEIFFDVDTARLTLRNK